MFFLVRKSTTVSVALLSAVAASGIPGEIVHAESARVSVAPAMIERGGFGEIIEKYWIPSLVGLWGAFVVVSRISGGE